MRTLTTACLIATILTAGGLAEAQVQVAEQAPRLDVVFAIDATGSMGDEIDQVRRHLWSTVTSILAGQPRPDLRVGLVIYRDRGDSEHLRHVPLTRDIDSIHRELMSLPATGGGDYREDVNAALNMAVNGVRWGHGAARLIFLIGDAPPQEYGEINRRALISAAAERRIRIHTIEASGLDQHGQQVWSQIAAVTGGTAHVLTYSREVVLADGGRVTTLHRRGRSYRARRVLTEAERAEPVDALVERGLVEEGEVPAASRSTRRRAGRAAPMPAADSDVGAFMADEAREAAAEAGVAY
jgi:Mg-chelatase subunit ChlD